MNRPTRNEIDVVLVQLGLIEKPVPVLTANVFNWTREEVDAVLVQLGCINKK